MKLNLKISCVCLALLAVGCGPDLGDCGGDPACADQEASESSALKADAGKDGGQHTDGGAADAGHSVDGGHTTDGGSHDGGFDGGH